MWPGVSTGSTTYRWPWERTEGIPSCFWPHWGRWPWRECRPWWERGSWRGKSLEGPPPLRGNSASSSTGRTGQIQPSLSQHRRIQILMIKYIWESYGAWESMVWQLTLPLPLWGPSHSLVCCISPAWKESSSTGIFWWMAWRPQCQERNRRSHRHPQAQSRTQSWVWGGLPLTCEQTGAIFFNCGVHSFRLGWLPTYISMFLPVSYEVRIVIWERYVLHPFTIHFFTDFINCSLRTERMLLLEQRMRNNTQNQQRPENATRNVSVCVQITRSCLHIGNLCWYTEQAS